MRTFGHFSSFVCSPDERARFAYWRHYGAKDGASLGAEDAAERALFIARGELRC